MPICYIYNITQLKQETIEMFKKEVTLGQLIAASMTIVSIVVGAYINVQVSITKMDTELTRMKIDIVNNAVKIESNDDKVAKKLDNIMEILTDIRVNIAKNQKDADR